MAFGLRNLLPGVHLALNPDLYHGERRQPPFFEQWYFKMVSAGENQRCAVMPGVILGEEGHAFIQVLDGVTGHTSYHEYPLSDFWASPDEFALRIGPNVFTAKGLSLQIDDDQGRIHGDVRFGGLQPWPVTLTAPGAMGALAWEPTLECQHGVLSFEHGLQGDITINNIVLNFRKGRGYAEKDWGQAFPESYLWFQTNHFEAAGTSLMALNALITRRGAPLRGFIIGLWHEGQLYRFTTTTRAKIDSLAVTDEHVAWTVSDRNYRLQLLATRAAGGLLRRPTRQGMGRCVDGTLSAVVDVHLTTWQGKTLYSSQGGLAGLELAGDLERLVKA
jgi:hypothetical protein